MDIDERVQRLRGQGFVEGDGRRRSPRPLSLDPPKAGRSLVLFIMLLAFLLGGTLIAGGWLLWA